jgi:Lon-like ATP-dependent protease
MALEYKTTKDINVTKKLIDQVVGQEDAVKVMKKAALQRRHVLLIGEPGTGKSMLGIALAEMLPKEKLVDILSFPNPNDENNPLVRTMPAGKGRELVMKAKIESMNIFKNQNIIMFALAITCNGCTLVG